MRPEASASPRGTSPPEEGPRDRTGPAGGDPPETWPTGRLLSTAARLAEHAWDAHLARWGLNHASFAVLWMLAAGPASQRELAHRAQVEDQTMSRTLDGLVRHGYALRERSPTDRRRLVVTLTERGERACREAGDAEVAERLVAGAVAPEDLATLRAHLVTVVRHLGSARWGGPADDA